MIGNIINNGWLAGVDRRPSPHFNERPEESEVDLLIIHGISLPPGQFGGPWIEDFFLGCLDTKAHPAFAQLKHLRVASHLLIKRNGGVIQFVSFERRAWHAGQSQFEGRTDCNDFAIGIELEGADDVPYENAQYDILTGTIQVLMQHYPAINSRRIVGHCDVSPGRKTDPGPAFDWDRLHRLLENCPDCSLNPDPG